MAAGGIAAGKVWRDGQGAILREPPSPADLMAGLRVTKVVLATAHRDAANNAVRNPAAWCRRCHMLHDAPEHRRWLTAFRRKALRDLFRGP